ncbi:VCBS repeat protein [Flavobacteriaceae bacterium MAR_2009_75]|nr:VCBS repeat protein [Flavobacteriaceae bacterium MAR_2009_75]
MKNRYSYYPFLHSIFSDFTFFKRGVDFLILGFALFSFFQIGAQCNSTPFPDQWQVHQLESSEFSYRLVYIYADFDIDGDGRKDIVTGAWWYRNPGSASGNWVRNTIGATFNNMAHIHDFDGDGDLDLLGTTGTYRGSDLVWAENNGSGSFTIHNNIPSGDTNYHEPFIAGIAGDDFQDNGTYQIAINWNGAESTNSPVQMLTVPADPVNTQWPIENISNSSLGEDLQKGDIDNDGNLDLFQSKNWLRNNGNGTWTTINTGIDYATTPDRVQLSDFDGDGDLDAAVGQLTGGSTTAARMEFAWWENPSNSSQNWTKHLLASDIRGSLSVFAEDIDNDGDDDITVGEWKGNNRLITFENDLCDSGNFIRHTINGGGTGFDHHDGARVVDIDNDGDFDIVSIGWDNIIPRIFENTTQTTSNDPPTVSAGNNQSITLPTNNITLNGSGNDPDGGSVDFLWTQVSGPNNSSLSNEDTKDLSASNLIEGEYIFRLTVTDDENTTASDEVTVTVNPEMVVTEDPIADAGEDQSITLPTNNIMLNGSGNDPDGGSVDFLWTQVSGPNNSSLSNEDTKDFSASNLIEGEYIFRLTVTDDENTTASDEVTVTVNPEVVVTEEPIADAGVDQSITLPTNNITLNGSGNDPDGGSVDILWTQVSGPNTSSLSDQNTKDLSASGLIEGEYIFRLTVTDDENTTASDEVTVTVNPEVVVTEEPIADAGVDQSITLPTNNIMLNGSGDDPDGGSVDFLWTQVSGPNTSSLSDQNTKDLSASGLIEGEYIFRLTVTDDENKTASDEVTVTVNPEMVVTEVPIAKATADIVSGPAPLEVQFNGTESMSSEGVLSYLWDFGNEDNSSETNPTYLFNTVGTYQVSLTVTDSNNMSDTTQITIMVTDSEEIVNGEPDIILEVNPAQNGSARVLLINQPAEMYISELNVHDSTGKLLNSFHFTVNSMGDYQVPVSTLSSGIYYLNLKMSTGDTETLTMVINQ